QRDWNQVSTSSDPAAIRDFLRKHGNGKYAAEAQKKLEELEWANVKNSGLANNDKLKAFLAEFGNGPHGRAAKDQLDDNIWNSVDKSKLDDLNRFTRDNPDNRHIQDARNQIEQIQNRLQTEKQKQDELKKQQDAALRAEKQMISDTVDLFNSINQRNRQDKDLITVWPSAPPGFKNVESRARLSCDLDSIKLPGDSAEAACTLSIRTQRGAIGDQTAKVTFQRVGAKWQIQTLL